MTLLSQALTWASLAMMIQAKGVHKLDLDIHWTNQQVGPHKARDLVSANGEWPPPAIFLESGDTYYLNVTNHLTDLTSVHNHGLFFRGNNYDDGVGGVTQCAIPVGHSYTYKVNTEKQIGTFWYHSHVKGQYSDGLKAPVIIKGDYPPRKIDDEYTLMMSDWYDDKYDELYYDMHNNNRWGEGEPQPVGILVYALDSRGNQLPGYNDEIKLNFEPNKTYRLRMLNAGSFVSLFVWLDHHDLEIIELDGVTYPPTPIDQVSLGVGQRVSVIVRAKPEHKNNYKLHMNFGLDMYANGSPPPPSTLNHTLNIVYNEKAPYASETVLDAYRYIEDYTFKTMTPLDAHPQYPNQSYTSMRFEFRWDTTHLNEINNQTFLFPSVPQVIAAKHSGDNAWNRETYNGCNSSTYVYPYGHGVHLRMLNADPTTHPFHMHGYEFQVLQTVKGIDCEDPDQRWKVDVPEDPKIKANPPRRDTVMIPGRSYVDLAIFANNPGAWAFHCHVMWHLSDGLAAVLLVGPDRIQKNMKIPSPVYEQCASMGVNIHSNSSATHQILR